MNFKLSIILFVSSIIFVACFKTPEYPIEPTLEFDSYNATQPYNTDGDSIGSMILRFTDGDGDLGKLNNQDSSSRIILTNNFFSAIDTFVIPIIPNKGTTKAISGTLEVKLNFLIGICLVPGVKQPLDTALFKIFIEDRAGHKSNVITTPPLVIKCP